MIPRVTQARTLFCAGLLVFGMSVAWGESPPAEQILRTAREASLQTEAAYRAELEDEEGESVPLTISARDGVVSYAFTDPAQTIQLVLGPESSELREVRDGRTVTIRAARYAEVLRGTNVTFEDLSLRLLYWPRARVLGEETVRTRRTWKLEMPAPRGDSQYGAARVWIDQKSGAVMQIEAYDPAGRLVKRFEVISAQQRSGRWMLRTMRVESLDPATGKPTRRTYLRVRDEVKAG